MKRKVIAVTGGIGSGKSEVCKILHELGRTTVDCDALARQIADEPEVIAAVERLLGSDCVSNGALNRANVRKKVFKDERLLKRYNDIFHERVRMRLNEVVEHADGDVFVEIAVIDAFEFDFDEIWLVKSRKNTRIDRVIKRDKVSATSVERIMSRQRYDVACTRVIRNDGTVEQLREQVLQAL